MRYTRHIQDEVPGGPWGAGLTDTCGILYCKPLFHEFCVGCYAKVGVGDTSSRRGFRPSGETDVLKNSLGGGGDSLVGKVFACKHEDLSLIVRTHI